ncbi:MAG: DUF6516 family protein [Desulfobacterales bacterium]
MIAVAKRLSIYEKNYNMTSETFYHKYKAGKTDDKLDFVEWANDYDHYMVLKSETKKNCIKLHKLLTRYFKEIEDSLRGIRSAHIEKYEEEILTEIRANLRIRIRFLSEYLFDANEAVIADNMQFSHLGYRYHFQGSDNRLVFRYDDTPHFPDIDSFPHHKHLPSDVIGSEKPSLVSVIRELFDFIDGKM